MECTIEFKILGLPEKYKLEKFNPEKLGPEKDIYSLLFIIEKLLANENKTIKNSIIQALKQTLLSGNSLDTYGKNTRYIPNYLGNELKAAFPDVAWGEEVPNVLLVNSTAGISIRNDHSFISRVIHYPENGEMKEMFIVPVHQIENFAAYTRAITNINKIKKLKDYTPEIIEKFTLDLKVEYEKLLLLLEEAENLFSTVNAEVESGMLKSKLVKQRLSYIFTEIKHNIDKLYKELTNERNSDTTLKKEEKEIKKLKEDQEKLDKNSDSYIEEFNSISSKIENIEANITRIKQIKKTHPLDIYTWIKMYLKNAQDPSNLAASSVSKDLVREYRKLLKELKQKYGEEIINRESEEMSNDKLKKHLDAIETIKTSKSLSENLPNALEQILQRYPLYTSALSWDLIARVDALIMHLADKETSNHSSIPTVNTINWYALLNGDKISKKFIEDYFFEKGLCGKNPSDSELRNLFQEHYIKNQDTYYLLNKNFNSEIKLSKYKNYVIDKLGLRDSAGNIITVNRNNIQNIKAWVNTFIGVKPYQNIEGKDYMYNGYYIYNLEGKWFYSKELLGIYTKARLFDSKNELEKYIDNSLDSVKLRGEIFDFENINSVDAVITPPGKFYKAGLILRVINYPQGEYSIPDNFSVRDFRDWVSYTFSTYAATKIFNKLTSPEQMAIFYTHYRKGVGQYLDTSYYNMVENDIINTINAISKATFKHYIVSDDTYTLGPVPKAFQQDRRTFYTRLREVDLNSIDLGTDPNNTSNIPILDWEAIKSVFTKYGINMLLLSEDQVKDKRVDSDTKAFMQGGIIYINIDRASMQDAFHEYTHILLGIVRNNDEKMYKDLLFYFLNRLKEGVNYDSIWSDKKSLYKEQINRLKLLGKTLEDIDLFILEEIFADQYAQYLLNNNILMDDIFKIVDLKVSESPMFNNLSSDKLSKVAKNKFLIFFLFSSEMLRARRVSGYGLALDLISVDKYQELENSALEIELKETFKDGLGKKESGLYKYCE